MWNLAVFFRVGKELCFQFMVYQYMTTNVSKTDSPKFLNSITG